MLHYTDVGQAQKMCECLACPARVEILRLVLSKKAESLDSLAATLHMTNGAISQHVKKLCEAGLVRLEEAPGKRGKAKRCLPAVDRIMIDIATDITTDSSSVFELPIGHFAAASVNPYCAIATAGGYIGERDDPRYFTFPERADAALIYFNSGTLRWTLPAPPQKNKRRKSISISLELSSKPSGHGRTRDSEITFFINDIRLGSHTVGGEYTDRKGLFTPPDFDDCPQYGRLKTLKITHDGTFIDGIKIGDVNISDLRSPAAFALSAENGVALFGKTFGDYDRGILYKIDYE